MVGLPMTTIKKLSVKSNKFNYHRIDFTNSEDVTTATTSQADYDDEDDEDDED